MMVLNEKKELYFPHQEIRDGQKELIKDIQFTITNNKVLLAHAPTGIGKTASVLAVAIKEALENKKKIFFLTNRHTQHQIAVNTLKQIKKKYGKEIVCADLIGKRFMCNQEISGLFGNDFNEYCKTITTKGECEFYNNFKLKNSLTAETKLIIKNLKFESPLHNEELIEKCKNEKICSYEISLELAKNAQVIIGDYYYLFNPHVQSTIINKLNIKMEDIILIVDEGHNLPNRITEMLSTNLTSNMLKNGILEAKKYGYKGMIFWLQELTRIINEIANFGENNYNKEIIVKKEEFQKQVNKVVDYNQFIEELEFAADEIRKKQRRSYLGGISTFLEAWKSYDEGFVRFIAEKQTKYGSLIMLSHSCLDPSIVTKDIFKEVNSAIIMSGTLQPMLMYKDILGIENCLDKKYNSPFPAENKLNLVVPETTTKFTARNDKMFQHIAQKCSEFSELIPGNVAFFFPSYYLRDKICEHFDSMKKLFWEKQEMNKEEKEKFLADFKNERLKGGVLLGVTGANFAEGVDFPGDLLNGVIVVGLPLSKPNLKTKAIINYYDQKFNQGWNYGYLYPAMNKCFQSSGRCIRSEKDRGVVIFLDERFSWKNYYSCLPQERLIVSKNYQVLIRKFFE